MALSKHLQQTLNIEDICLMRYCVSDEKKSLLVTVLEIDEFSDYHPVKLVCNVDTEAMTALKNGMPVSLVSKNPATRLYVLLKGNVFQKSVNDGYVILSINDVQYFTREQTNNISSFKKIKSLSVLSAA